MANAKKNNNIWDESCALLSISFYTVSLKYTVYIVAQELPLFDIKLKLCDFGIAQLVWLQN